MRVVRTAIESLGGLDVVISNAVSILQTYTVMSRFILVFEIEILHLSFSF